MKRNVISVLLLLPVLALVGHVCWVLRYVSRLNGLLVKSLPRSWSEVEARLGEPSSERGPGYEHLGLPSCKALDGHCKAAAWYDAPYIATCYLFGFDAEGNLVVRRKFPSP